MDAATLYFLFAGVVAVVIVGRLLAFSGKRYLAGSGAGRESAGSAATLVSMLFHLVTLGMTALLAAIAFGGSQAQVFLIRIGVLLVLVAVAYALALRMLTRRKDEAVVSDFDAQMRDLRRDRDGDAPEAAGDAPAPTRREPRP